MRKIPTLFVRDPDNRAHVINEVNPECQWVIDGEGVATRKFDGTCVMLDENGAWWARREVKQGKAAPPNYQPISTDLVTGKVMGWEPIEQSAFAKYHAEALDYSDNVLNLAILGWEPGTYELVGPKINGNPEGYLVHHVLLAHAHADLFRDAPRTFGGLREWLLAHPFEGIVWHHPDGRMAKLKRRDFA